MSKILEKKNPCRVQGRILRGISGRIHSIASGNIFGFLNIPNIWDDLCKNSGRILGRISRLMLGGLSGTNIRRIPGRMFGRILTRTPRSILVEKF